MQKNNKNFQNNKYFQKLELDLIIEELSSYAVNAKVKKNINELKPINNYDDLNSELNRTEEFLNIINRFEVPNIQIEGDFDQIIYRAFKGGTLTSTELYEAIKLDSTIRSAEKLYAAIQKEKIISPTFSALLNKICDCSEVYSKIKNAIDYDGTIYDNASEKLKQIRLSLKSMDGKIKQKLNEIVNREGKKLAEPLIVMRDNAYCLPIRAEYKNTVKGIIHDTSASMQTFYIEPAAIIELNLQKEKLMSDEYEEIMAILNQLSILISNYYDELKINFDIVKTIDFLTAKAMLAKKMNAVKPILRTDGHFNLIDARHPLLKVEHVISNTITIEDPAIGIIITGPNTGGKTVLLKTVGLLSLMTKFGLLIPCKDGSSISLFDKIFCDIGDDQSISSNLSTFSSHLSSIVDIINQTTSSSLVLFDEIGAGTDPLEGSNLAIAILKYLIANKVTFITTTHYSELKIFGFNEERVINASMEFDNVTLSPTYHLLLGITGSSNAFYIAKRMRLKNEIINDAIKLVENSGDENRLMIEKFEETSLEVKKLEKRLNLEIAKSNQIKTEYETKLKKLNQEKDNLIENARKEAETIINNAKEDAKKLIEKIETLSKNNPKLHDIASIKHEIKAVNVKNDEETFDDNNYQFKVGEDVYVPSYDQYGTIERISGNKFEITIGNMRINLKRGNFRPTKSNNVDKQIINKIGKDQISKATKKISMTLDLRGKRYEEAKDELERYLDDLILMGIKQGLIIHGFGTGTIRNLVQNFVKSNQNISEYRYGGEKEGGLGVTVITLK